MDRPDNLTEYTTRIVAAFLGRGVIEAKEVPEFMRSVHGVLLEMDASPSRTAFQDLAREAVSADADGAREVVSASASADASGAVRSEPVSDAEGGFVRNGIRTVFEDRIVCLDDGRSVVFLKRHLRSLRVDAGDYLRRWGLPADYPMVAPGYAAEKRRLALAAGLGRIVGARKAGSSSSGLPKPEAVVAGGPSAGRRERVRGTLHPAYAG